MQVRRAREGVKRAKFYLIPIMAVLAICLAFDVLVWNMTKRESAETMAKTAAYFTGSMDNRLQSLKAYAYDLMNSYYAAQLSALPEEGWTAHPGTAVRLTGSIFQVCRANDLAADVLVYYPQADRIVSRHSVLSPYQYFLVENPQLAEHPEQFQACFDEVFDRQDGTFFTVKNRFSGAIQCYYYRRTPGHLSSADCDRAMVIRLNQDAVRRLAAEISAAMGFQYAAMVTADGGIFAQAGKIDGTLVPQDETALLASLSGRRCAADRSDVLDMKLYFQPSASEVDRFLYAVQRITVAGLILAGIVGVSLALWGHLSREKYIHGILNQLGSSRRQSLDKAVAEHLERTYQENLHNIRIINRQCAMVRYSFLKELLRMNPFDQSKAETLAAAYDAGFENDRFSILAVAARAPEEQAEKDEILDFLRDGQFESCDVYWTRIEQLDLFLCNYGEDPEQAKSVERFRTQLGAAVSGQIYGSGVALPSMEACIGEFRRLYQVITGRKFEARGAPPAAETGPWQQLARAIADQDVPHQRLLTAQICEELRREDEDNRSFSRRYALLYELYNLPQLQKQTYLLDEMYRDMRCATWIRCLQSLIPRERAERDGWTQGSLAAEVVRIISEEYGNPQMGLSVLAGRLGVSQSYLSRIFKQTYNENISHYLSKTRIEQAKILMRTGSDNLNTIALRVGFLSDMNFIRVFKKLENETPGNFRKKNQ